MLWSLIVTICLLLCNDVYGAKQSIKIGGLFDKDDLGVQEMAFQYTVEAINRDREILPRHKLVAKTERVSFGDSFAVSQAVCKLLQEGAVGIFGPLNEDTSYHVQSICDTKDVPHMETRMDAVQGQGTLINVHPHPSALARMFLDLVKAWEWKTFTILYENSYSFPRLSELLKMYDPKGHTITVRQLDLGLGNNYRPILHRVKLSGETNFVLDCSVDILADVLIQAQQVGIMADQHSYIVTSPDLHTIDLEPFRYGGANITGIRYLDTEDPNLIDILENWRQRHSEKFSDPEQLPQDTFTPETLTSSSALMHDAVKVFALGLHNLNSSSLQHRQFSCEQDDSWEHGTTMINFMKTNHLQGLTRSIKFDHFGYRTDILLDIVELTPAGIQKVGTWNSTEGEGFNFTRLSQDAQLSATENSLVNRTFRVLTALSAPYGMLREASAKLTGNDRFEGFGIEVIQELSSMLGFNYTFSIQEDGAYGSLNKETGEWNGMVKELLEHRADLAITDLTITSDRESAVDFTMPFMNLGISILFAKPSKQPPRLFSFMSPFSGGVWLLLGIAYVSASILIFMSGRIAPQEWQNPYPCIEEPEELSNQFSMPNSLWFMVGAVLQQGSEIAPIAMSTRMIAGVWWFFTLIMVSSYTANLAAFLTVQSLYSPISNAADLANNKVGITYGAKRGGSTLSFFKDADDEIYQKMYAYMDAHPEALTGSNDEGVARVKAGGYAYLMESTSIEYITERNCDIAMVNGLLDDKGYGIAMRKNSPYRNTLSTAVLKLQEQGKLTAMKTKWWTEKRGGGACQKAMDKDENAELGMPNVGGVFVVLVGGCTLSGIIAFGEMLCGILSRARKFKVPFRQELMEELRFVIKCSGDTKPVRHRKSGSGSEQSAGSGERGSELGKSKETLNTLRVPGTETPKANQKVA